MCSSNETVFSSSCGCSVVYFDGTVLTPSRFGSVDGNVLSSSFGPSDDWTILSSFCCGSIDGSVLSSSGGTTLSSLSS